MSVYIRVDASTVIGTGHVMRCLTLADGLRQAMDTDIIFLSREHEGHLIAYIRSRGYRVLVLPPADETRSIPSARVNAYEHWLGAPWQADAAQTISLLRAQQGQAEWFIIDHYALDDRYEQAIRPHVEKIMVLDDLADRPHSCDLLLDQNVHEHAEARYAGLLASGTQTLFGPDYALLREAFAAVRPKEPRDGTVHTVLVSFGGADHTGETGKTLRALEPLILDGLRVIVLAGKLNPHQEALAQRCLALPNTRFYSHVEDVASLMVVADLAIGSGGSTTWERCCLGLPAILITTAANQLTLTSEAQKAGVLQGIGRSEQVQSADIRRAVSRALAEPKVLHAMSVRGMALIDGLGVQRTVKEMQACRQFKPS